MARVWEEKWDDQQRHAQCCFITYGIMRLRPRPGLCSACPTVLERPSRPALAYCSVCSGNERRLYGLVRTNEGGEGFVYGATRRWLATKVKHGRPGDARARGRNNPRLALGQSMLRAALCPPGHLQFLVVKVCCYTNRRAPAATSITNFHSPGI